jgi:pre-mRNA-processing factor SLU7
MDSQNVSVREEMRQKRQEDEARKAGKLAPLQDERGHEINPYMPQFLSNVPFYINSDQKPSLSHQRSSSGFLSSIPIQEYYQRGVTL